MDTNVIKECTAQSLAEKITFPEVVMKLAGAGVERYIADLVGLRDVHTHAGTPVFGDLLLMEVGLVLQADAFHEIERAALGVDSLATKLGQDAVGDETDVALHRIGIHADQ